MQCVLQAGLSFGMSAVSGLHTGKHVKPNPVRESHTSFDGLFTVIPESQIPSARNLVTYKGKHGNVQAPPLCIGAWPWGDKSTLHWDDPEFFAVQQTWQHSVSKGVNFIDTTQVYGTGESEAICGRLMQAMDRNSFHIQTKYFVVPQLKEILQPTQAPLKKLETSCKNLRIDCVDIYLVHGPIHVQSIGMIAKSMAECVEQGLTKCFGVANYSAEDMIKFANELAR